MGWLSNWVKQPTTVAGLSTTVGTFVALILHQVDWIQAAPLLAGAAMSALLPDNASARAQVQSLTNELVQVSTSNKQASLGSGPVKVLASTR